MLCHASDFVLYLYIFERQQLQVIYYTNIEVSKCTDQNLYVKSIWDVSDIPTLHFLEIIHAFSMEC